MGGNVSTAQRDGGGKTFTLVVLLKRAEKLSTMLDDGDVLSLLNSGSLRLLSVEDNPFGRVVLNAILTELGHKTEFIGNCEAAPETITQGPLACVMMG